MVGNTARYREYSTKRYDKLKSRYKRSQKWCKILINYGERAIAVLDKLCMNSLGHIPISHFT